ncbi:MAG: hypothetical protein KY467_11020 [Gemmatimonadetes bacterium]|nr:hypothetical protein [Gemmatimonadota bacterium]
MSELFNNPKLFWSVLGAFAGVLAPLLGLTWILARSHYQARLEAQVEENQRLRLQIDESSPKRLLEERKSLRDLGYAEAEATYTPKILEKDREIRRIQEEGERLRKQLDEPGRENLNRRLRQIEQEKHDLERLRDLAFDFADRLSRAAVRGLVRAEANEQRTRATKVHDFLKNGDAVQEWKEIADDMLASGAASAEDVLYVDASDGGLGVITHVKVRGHAFFERLSKQPGWQILKRADDAVANALTVWTHLVLDIPRKPPMDPIISYRSDRESVEFSIEGGGGIVHTLVILATLGGGWPHPMARVFSGPADTSHAAARAFIEEHRPLA